MTGLDPLAAVLLAAGLASALVVTLALAALARRRSASYVLVTLALATLLTRTLVGVLSVRGVLGTGPHHLLEHGLDVVTVVLLFGAVYAARTVDPPAGGEPPDAHRTAEESTASGQVEPPAASRRVERSSSGPPQVDGEHAGTARPEGERE